MDTGEGISEIKLAGLSDPVSGGELGGESAGCGMARKDKSRIIPGLQSGGDWKM